MKPQPKILVVDDTEVHRTTIVHALKEEGFYDVVEARDGKEALELHDKHNPDIMLLDLVMPRVDGPGVLAELRKQAAKVKVIVITEVNDIFMEENVRNLFKNVMEYITKPFQEVRVIEAVRAVAVTL